MLNYKQLMKYLKPYTLFESIHPNNTNITELDPNFVYDITDICADLNSDFPQTDKDGRLISFYSPSFRSVALKDPLPEYPSISIHMPYYMYGYKFGDKTKHDISIECPELKQVALRIKEFLGDSYKAFVLKNGPKNTIHTLSDNTSFSSGISGFQIVYDPTKFLKRFNESISSEDIIDDCKQILLDISDDYVKFDIKHDKLKYLWGSPRKPLDVIHLTIGDYPNGKSFDPGDYIEPLEQLNSYLNSNGYKYFSNGTHYWSWEGKMSSIKQFKGTSAGKLTLMDIYWTKDIVSESMGNNKLFESRDILNNIKDIFLEIEDIGFRIEYNRGGVGELVRIYISKYDVYGFSDELRPVTYIPGQEFILALQHLISYLLPIYDIEIESFCNSGIIDHLSSKSEDGLIENDVKIIGEKEPIDYIKIVISDK